MPEMEKEKLNQNIILENRKNLKVYGVNDVNSFNEEQIVATTILGFLTIKGSKLHVQKFNIKTKELNITGKIDELKYKNTNENENKSFFKKIFK